MSGSILLLLGTTNPSPSNLRRNTMYTVETVESLQAYADRLHRDRTAASSSAFPRRSSVRALVRRVRRSA
jgi:hypothetical protein